MNKGRTLLLHMVCVAVFGFHLDINSQLFVSRGAVSDGSEVIEISTITVTGFELQSRLKCELLCSIPRTTPTSGAGFVAVATSRGQRIATLESSSKMIDLSGIDSSWVLVENATSLIEGPAGSILALLCFTNPDTKMYRRVVVNLKTGGFQKTGQDTIKPLFSGQTRGDVDAPIPFAWIENNGLRFGKDSSAPLILHLQPYDVPKVTRPGALILAGEEHVLILEPLAQSQTEGERSALIYHFALKSWSSLRIAGLHTALRFFYPWAISVPDQLHMDRSTEQNGPKRPFVLKQIETGLVLEIAPEFNDSEPLLVSDSRLIYRDGDCLYSIELLPNGLGVRQRLAQDSRIRDVHWALPSPTSVTH